MSFIRNAFLRTSVPSLEVRRFRSKLHIQRPRAPHFERQLLMDVCKPMYPSKKVLPQIELCEITNKRKYPNAEVDNPFEHILAKECFNWFSHSRMMGFFHLNPVSMEIKGDVFANLKGENMHLRVYGRKIIDMAIDGTPYEAIKPLFVNHTNIIFSESVQPKVMLKILKNIPALVMMAGVIDGRLLSRNEFMEYSKMPSLDITRAQLCQVLDRSGSNLVNQMNQHQSALVNQLDNYKMILEKKNEDV